MIQFSPELPKAPSEDLMLSMDVSKQGWLLPGESVASVVTGSWSCQVYSGIDPSPMAMISGAATIGGTSISQLVVGGLEGVVYLFLCTFLTNTGRTLVGRALLRVATT